MLDICFNPSGTRLVTASADSTAIVYNVHTCSDTALLKGDIIIDF